MKTEERSRRAIAAVAGIGGVLVLAAALAEAARFPDRVERRFRLDGDLAVQAAAILGLEGRAELELPAAYGTLGNDCRHRTESGEAVFRPCDAALPMGVRVRWNPAEPALELEGVWLDRTTGTGPKTPRYEVHSQALASDPGPGGEVWLRLLEGAGVAVGPLMAADPAAPGAVLWSKSTPDEEQTQFGLTVVRAPAGRVAVVVAIDDDGPEVGRQRREAYAACLANQAQAGRPRDGGC